MPNDFFHKNPFVMNTKTRLLFIQFIRLAVASLALIFLIFTYAFVQINSVEEPMGECGVVDTFPNKNKIDTEELKLGRDLFKNKCASCHAKNMKVKMTGPPLAGVNERWEKENLHRWIKNAPAYLVNENDDYAKKLALEYKAAMNPFPELSDEDIDAILNYIEVVEN